MRFRRRRDMRCRVAARTVSRIGNTRAAGAGVDCRAARVENEQNHVEIGRHPMTTRRRPSFSSALCYRNPKAALAWLERAFGFERAIVVTTPEGDIAHAEMKFGDGLVMIGGAWAEFIASPEDTGDRNTQHVHVQLPDDADIDAHCERARAAGAEILQAPADQFYGDRVYRARDPGRHVWTFGKHVRGVTNDEMSAATGLTIEDFE